MNKKMIARELVKVAGELLGPGIPDGTGPMKNSPSCPKRQIEVEGYEEYLEEYRKGDIRVVIELEDSGEFEVEVYKKSASGWDVVSEDYYDSYEEAKARFNEIISQY